MRLASVGCRYADTAAPIAGKAFTATQGLTLANKVIRMRISAVDVYHLPADRC